MGNAILTSHAGSLPRPDDLIELNRRRLDGEGVDEAEYAQELHDATIEVVERQKALGIDLRLNGLDLCAPGPLRLATSAAANGRLGRSVRIGLTRAAHRVLRFYERGNAYVSGPKRLCA